MYAFFFFKHRFLQIIISGNFPERLPLLLHWLCGSFLFNNIFQSKTNQVAAWIWWNKLLIKIGIQESVFLYGLSVFPLNTSIHDFDQAVKKANFFKISNKTWSNKRSTPPSHAWYMTLGQTTGSNPYCKEVVILLS